jgi:F-type H+-transporting ATPase subunit b
LVFLLNRVLFRPIRKSLLDRKAELTGLEAGIEQLSGQAQGLLGQVQENLTDARRQGLGRREALRQEGSQSEASLLAQVKQELDAEWARVEQKIKADVAQARESLKTQAQSFAQLLATKILGRELS